MSTITSEDQSKPSETSGNPIPDSWYRFYEGADKGFLFPVPFAEEIARCLDVWGELAARNLKNAGIGGACPPSADDCNQSHLPPEGAFPFSDADGNPLSVGDVVVNINRSHETYEVAGFANHVMVYGGRAFIDGSQLRLVPASVVAALDSVVFPPTSAVSSVIEVDGKSA